MRETCCKYRFGRAELLPIKKTGEAVAWYVAGYLSKSFGLVPSGRKNRLVRYSRSLSQNMRLGTEGIAAKNRKNRKTKGQKDRLYRMKIQYPFLLHSPSCQKVLRCHVTKSFISEKILPRMARGLLTQRRKVTARPAATEEFEQEQTEETENEKFCQNCAILVDTLQRRKEPLPALRLRDFAPLR